MKRMPQKKHPVQNRNLTKTILTYLAAGLVLLVVLLPFLWVIVSSFKSEQEILSAPTRIFAKKFTIINYLSLIKEHTASKNFSRNIANSLVIAFGTTIFTVIVATLAGFSLSRYRNRWSEVFAKIFIFIYVFPTVVIIVPLFKMFSTFKLSDSFLGLIIVETTFAIHFCTWLLRSFFDTIPIDLEESAMIDGATDRQAFLHVTFPLSSAGIATAAIYTFITSWGEYVFSSIFLISDTKKTVPLGIVTYMGDMYIEWGKLLAGSVLLIMPVLIFFYPLAKYFIQGFMSGALKE
ncbi:MAG: carbohydrate ABC transporter permease [Firmicutes bacterium]|nr:carbohydrate ABC transporter permease [Bacillota bacterium]